MGLFKRKIDKQPDPYQNLPIVKSDKKKLILIVVLTVLSILLIGGGFYYYTYKTSPLPFKINKAKLSEGITSDQTNLDEISGVVNEVKKIMLLPDETPILATVTDLEKVKNQTFFEKAALGDKVLIYMQAKKAILYRPSQKMIIEVGRVNDTGSMGQVAGENISVTEPTPIPETTGLLPKTTPVITPLLSVTQKPTPTSTEY